MGGEAHDRVSCVLLGVASVLVVALATPVHAEVDWKQVKQIFGRPAAEQPGGVHRFSLPALGPEGHARRGWIRPALALGSWLAFKEARMARPWSWATWCSLEDEVNPVMSRLAEDGIEITALHNHLLRAQPATMYMHVEGHGDPMKLAETLRLALERSKTPVASRRRPLPRRSKGRARHRGPRARLSATKARQTAASTSSRSRAPSRSRMAAWRPPAMGTAIAINFQPLARQGGHRPATSC